jgi:hypothetical protein
MDHNKLALRELEQSAGKLRLRRIARRRSSFAFRYAALRMGAGPRPVITAAPEQWQYGQAVEIASPPPHRPCGSG